MHDRFTSKFRGEGAHRASVQAMSAPTGDPLRGRLLAIETLIRAGDLTRAAEALAQARAIAPGDVRLCLAEAALARSARDGGREIAALRRAVALTPRWPVAHVELSKALARDDKFEEAVAAANKAVELAPNELATREVAVAVANQAGSYADAERHLRAASALRPEDLEIARALASCLSTLKRFAEAEPLYRRVLAADPRNPSALANLGECLTELGRRDEAIVCLERALERVPHNAALQFNLAVARGETPPTQPNELTQMLFDEYSARFDKHLAGTLKYRVPRRVAEIIRARHSDLRIDVLDLGCGTGLTGVYLGGIGGALVGVDLSAGMIERARRHGIYTQLRQGDLREELRESAPGSYDCVIANDVFIYVGDIAEVVRAAFDVLRVGGALIFSCETAADAEGDFVLRASKRYAHSHAYVERLCRGAGFDPVGFEEIDLRIEGDAPIPGFVVVAEKR